MGAGMWAGKRGVLEIVAGILSCLAESSLKRTHITYKANLDSRAASKYITLLLRVELITRSKEDPSNFVITEKGRDFVRQYEVLTQIVDVISKARPVYAAIGGVLLLQVAPLFTDYLFF